MVYVLPSSAHNEQLPDDELTTLTLNYQWRQIVAIAVLTELTRTLKSDVEAEQDQFTIWINELMEDLYNGEIVDNTPVGTIVAFIGLIADIPPKWLPCNNSTYLQADYPELAAILKATFKSGSNFNTPNLQGHYIRGAADDSDHSGESGNNLTTLVEANLPAHHHSVPAHSHTFSSFNNAGSGGANVVASGGTGGAGTKTSSTQAATDTSDIGSATSFSNEPLHYRFHWIIKALP